jgi:transcriptional regulator with XRE-family HTH domain
LSTGPEKVSNESRQGGRAGSVVYMEERELKAILGKNIKSFRSRRQLSQADLAEKAGISITFLSNIERGNNFPLAGTLCSLAKALEVEVFELFKGDLAPSDSKELVNQLSEDITKKINLAMTEVFKQYTG